MDKSKLINELEKSIPGAILQIQRFGKRGPDCLWIEAQKLGEITRHLNEDFNFRFLENLSVMQIDDALVLTYFLRQTNSETGAYGNSLVLRLSLQLKKPDQAVEVPSVASVWMTALPFEIESGELFGIHYIEKSGERRVIRGLRLPDGWVGYPMRKGYPFPEQFQGIRHERSWAEKKRGVDS